MYIAHNYEEMTELKRPQDESMNGAGWTFITAEHGGEFPDMFPNAIIATDPHGRRCVYTAVSVNGRVVDSKGYVSDSTAASRIENCGLNFTGRPAGYLSIEEVKSIIREIARGEISIGTGTHRQTAATREE